MACPRLAKKKKENRTRAQKTKATGTRLENFVDWRRIIASEPVEEEEMSSLIVEFSVLMRKQAVSLKDETTPRSGGKRLRQSSPNEEARKD